MTRAAVVALALAVIGPLVPVAAAAVPAEASAAAVNVALGKATKWLLSTQTGDNWEGSPALKIYKEQATGWTALAVDALLSAGVSPRDPAVDKAVKYLKAHDTTGVYALGLRMQVWQRLPPAADVRAAAKADLAKLLADVGTKGDTAGMYGYYGPLKSAKSGYSHSRSQYAVQGAAAARAMGLEVPDAWWKSVEQGWADHQAGDGGWSYTKANDKGYPETNGMTSVAVASLLLAHEALNQDASVTCTGAAADPAIAKGLAWLAAHADAFGTDDRTPRAYPFPTLYGVERVGAAGGIKYFGSVNWYQKGAAWLLSTQRDEGDWGSTASRTIDGVPAAFDDTCFAVLFLARGRVPLFMQKLDYATAFGAAATHPQWNERPRDAANLAAFAGRSLEQDLGWEQTTLAAPERDLHDAPILYLSGKDPVAFDAKGMAKLRAFVDGGGMVVANADCGGAGFANSIRKLGTAITPYEFRTLPANHPVFTRQQFTASRWKRKPTVLGLSNRVRELMILLPNGDPGRYWNAGSVPGHEADFELGADLFQYVASRGDLRSRGESYVPAADPSVTPTAVVPVGRLKYADNWDPEPGSWPALAATMHNRDQLGVPVSVVTAGDDWSGLPLVSLTGTERSVFPPALGAKVKAYLSTGGTLLVDAAGGSPAFAAVAGPAAATWAGGPLVPIPPDDPLFAAGGTPLGPVRYRPFAVDARGKLNVPRLKGVKIGGRWAVIFSDDDLSAGLVGEQVDGVIGYAPASATDIVRHVVLYAKKK